MSYNIDHVEAVVLDAWMKASDVLAVWKKLTKSHDTCEACFLEEMVDAATDACAEGHADRQIPLPNFWWYGEGSGNTYHYGAIKKIAPYIHGRVDAIFTWEGGDSTSALRIVDGNLIECELVQTIVAPKKTGEDDLDTPSGIRAALLKASKAPREPGKHEGNSFSEGWQAGLFEFANRLPKGRR